MRLFGRTVVERVLLLVMVACFPLLVWASVLVPPFPVYEWELPGSEWCDHEYLPCSAGEWTFKRYMSLYFQSLLEWLCPELFGEALPAGGGWHQWQYKVRKAADHPKKDDGYASQQGQLFVRGKKPVQDSAAENVSSSNQREFGGESVGGELTEDGTVDSDRMDEDTFAGLLVEFQPVMAQGWNCPDVMGAYSQFCRRIEKLVKKRNEALDDLEKRRFAPFMHRFATDIEKLRGESVASEKERLAVCLHSLAASGLLYPPNPRFNRHTARDINRVVSVQQSLLKQFFSADLKCGKEQSSDRYLVMILLMTCLQAEEGKLLSPGFAETLRRLTRCENLAGVELTGHDFVGLFSLLLRLDKDGFGFDREGAAGLLQKIHSLQAVTLSRNDSILLIQILAALIERDETLSVLIFQLVPHSLSGLQNHSEKHTFIEAHALVVSLVKLVEKGLPLGEGGCVRETLTQLLQGLGNYHPRKIDFQKKIEMLCALAQLVKQGVVIKRSDHCHPAKLGLLSLYDYCCVSDSVPHVPTLVIALNGLIPTVLSLDGSMRVRFLLWISFLNLRYDADQVMKIVSFWQILELLRATVELAEKGMSLKPCRVDRSDNPNVIDAVMAILQQIVQNEEKIQSVDIVNLLEVLAKLVGSGLPMEMSTTGSKFILYVVNRLKEGCWNEFNEAEKITALNSLVVLNFDQQLNFNFFSLQLNVICGSDLLRSIRGDLRLPPQLISRVVESVFNQLCSSVEALSDGQSAQAYPEETLSDDGSVSDLVWEGEESDLSCCEASPDEDDISDAVQDCSDISDIELEFSQDYSDVLDTEPDLSQDHSDASDSAMDVDSVS